MIPQRLRILFFDDDDDTREMTGLLFGEAGFEMVCAESASDLLSLAQTQRFDGYLLDNWTRDLSGVELCHRIREFDGHTPIVFYSGATLPEDKASALAAGAQAFIDKPEIKELMDALRQVASGSKAVK